MEIQANSVVSPFNCELALLIIPERQSENEIYELRI